MLQVPIDDVDIAPGHVFEWRLVTTTMRDSDDGLPDDPTTYNQEKHFAVAQEARSANDEHVSAYVAGTFDLQGPVDMQALEDALLYFVRRHEVLRSEFRQPDDDLNCDVIGPDEVSLKLVDVGELGTADDVGSYLHGFFQRIDPLVWPLIVMGAVVRDETTTVFFACDHLVTDGISTPVAVRDIATAYAALSRGEQPELPEVGSYLRFSREQRDGYCDMEADDSRLDHWREFMERGDFFPPFPLDLGVEEGGLHPSANEMEPLLAVPETEALESRCREHGAGLFAGILAAVGVTLRKEGGPDVYRGIMPVNERGRGAYAHTMGWFINTMPIEFSVAEDEGFGDVMANVRTASTEMQKNIDVPFVKAWQLLAPVEYHQMRTWPYAVNFFSYLDFRRTPGAPWHVEWNARKHIWASHTNGICFWFHRNDTGLYVNSVYVDTPEARHTKTAFVRTLRRTVDAMVHRGTF